MELFTHWSLRITIIRRDKRAQNTFTTDHNESNNNSTKHVTVPNDRGNKAHLGFEMTLQLMTLHCVSSSFHTHYRNNKYINISVWLSNMTISRGFKCIRWWVGFTTLKKSQNTPSVRVHAKFRRGEMWSCKQILKSKIFHWISRIHSTSLHCELCDKARKGEKSKNTSSHQCSINTETEEQPEKVLILQSLFSTVQNAISNPHFIILLGSK